MSNTYVPLSWVVGGGLVAIFIIFCLSVYIYSEGQSVKGLSHELRKADERNREAAKEIKELRSARISDLAEHERVENLLTSRWESAVALKNKVLDAIAKLVIEHAEVHAEKRALQVENHQLRSELTAANLKATTISKLPRACDTDEINRLKSKVNEYVEANDSLSRELDKYKGASQPVA